MSRSRTRVLWVTFDFPPRQSSAVYRPVKVFKYLDKESLDVHFLTQSLSFKFRQGVQDHSLLQEMGSSRVYKVPNWVAHDLLYALAPRRRRGTKKKAKPSETSATPTISSPGAKPPRSLAGRLYRTVVMLFYFPDQFFLWGWLSALTAVALHLWNRYDVVYTTSYPESAHLAGFLLRPLGVKWIVDYRYGGPLWIRKILTHPKSSLREKLDFWFQRLVLRSADFVVTQSDSIKADFVEAFALDPARMRTIPSGYDETDFTPENGERPPFEKKTGEIHVVHAGAAYLDQADRNRMIAELSALDRGLRSEGLELVFHALGDDLFGGGERGEGLSFRYMFHGVVPHPELPAYLRAADWYLLSTITSAAESDTIRGYLPSKMWEYLRGEKPIVLFGPKDEVWQIIDEAGAGVHLGALNGDEPIEAAVLLESVRALEPNMAKVKQHSWESRARSFEHVFMESLGSRAS